MSRTIHISSGKKRAEVIHYPPPPQLPPDMTEVKLEAKVEFPVQGYCLNCKKALNVRSPGLIKCPSCKDIAAVDGWGNFLERVEKKEP